jgi:hypothetical protein
VKRSHVFVFLLAATLLATFHLGVRFAVIDQQAQFPSIYRRLDASLFSRDFMYHGNLAFGPRTVVNAIITALARLFPLDAMSLVGVLLINFLMLWVTYRVTEELFPEARLAPLIAVVLVGALGKSLIPLGNLITQEMDPRAMGMPVAMFCLWLALRGRPVWCSVVALIGSLIHPTLLINTMLICLAGMGTAWLAGALTKGRVGVEKPGRNFVFLALGGVLFVVVSYLLWVKGYRIGSIDTKTLFEILQFRTPRSYRLLDFWGVRSFVIYAVFTLAALAAWLWWYPQAGREKRAAFTALGLVLGTGVMLAGAVVFVEFIPNRTWLSLDASSGIFVARWMGLLLIARSTSLIIEASAAGQTAALGSAAILIAGTGPAMAFTALWGHVVEWLRRRFTTVFASSTLNLGMLLGVVLAVTLWIRSGSAFEAVGLLLLAVPAFWFAAVQERPLRLIVPLVVSALLMIVVFSCNGRVASASVDRLTSLFHQVFTLRDLRVLPEEGEDLAAMADAGAFARRATPKDALFLTPPVGSLFRITALRSLVVDFKGMPANAAGMLEWLRRLEYCYGSSSKSGFDAVNDMDQRYHAITPLSLASIRSQYGADYALLYADTPDTGLCVLYANAYYKLVDMTTLTDSLRTRSE